MQVFIGQIFHSLALTEIESLPRAIIAVAKGKIAYIHSDYSSIPLDPNEDPTSLTKKLEGLIGSSIESIKILPHGSFLLPGLIDTHIHGTLRFLTQAPQYAFTGTGYDLPLLEWLNKYTFPSESTLSDDVKAAHVFDRCVERSLASGTTTACYYATIHLAASKILVDTMMV
jgi:guanine deaminase